MYTSETYYRELRWLSKDIGLFLDRATSNNGEKLAEVANAVLGSIASTNGFLAAGNLTCAAASSLALVPALTEIRALVAEIDHAKVDGYIAAIEALQSQS